MPPTRTIAATFAAQRQWWEDVRAARPTGQARLLGRGAGLVTRDETGTGG